jgi:feruloyl esterase
VLSDFIDNADPTLDRARAKGVKVLHTVGNYDKSIFWRQSLRYYRAVATNAGKGTADFAGTQSWYRLFVMPGQGDGAFHTIAPDATGPGVLDPFLALVDWVENSKAPDRLLAGSGSVANRTRPLCPYPQWAQYKGTGSTESADSFTCGGNLETADAVAQDVMATYKHENGD